MLRKYEYSSILGWSVSRFDTFTLCKRQYYYNYYSKYDPEVAKDKIASLRSLTSKPLEIGYQVHDTIATLLHRLRRSTSPIDTRKVLEYAYSQIDKAIEAKTFLETYYQNEMIDPGEMKERVALCLNNFFTSHWYEWLLTDAVVQRSNWVVEPQDFGEIRINGLKAYCKVDFLFPMLSGDIYVLDWKTGKSDKEKHGRQMKGYVLYAQDICDMTPDRIKPVIVYLGGSYGEWDTDFTESELLQFADQISLETHEMYDFCENVEGNTPKAKEYFSPTVTKLCAYCSYQELCETK